MRYEYDPLTVDALVQRNPVQGATTADLAQASKKLWDKGLEPAQIALQLRTTPRHINRLLDIEVVPMGEIPEWATRDDWPVCNAGHEQTPDNINSAGRCRMCKKNAEPRPEGRIVESAKHGTAYGYNHQRCRCDECRAANARASARRKQLLRERNQQQ